MITPALTLGMRNFVYNVKEKWSTLSVRFKAWIKLGSCWAPSKSASQNSQLLSLNDPLMEWQSARPHWAWWTLDKFNSNILRQTSIPYEMPQRQFGQASYSAHLLVSLVVDFIVTISARSGMRVRLIENNLRDFSMWCFARRKRTNNEAHSLCCPCNIIIILRPTTMGQ